MKIESALNTLPATSIPRGRSAAEEGWKVEVARPKPSTPDKLAIEPKEVEQAVKEINDYMQLVRRNLEFSVDKDTQRVVVKVIDAETGELVRQIPPDAVLELAKFLRERENKGLLLAQHA